MDLTILICVVGALLFAPVILMLRHEKRTRPTSLIDSHWIMLQEKDIWGKTFTLCNCGECEAERTMLALQDKKREQELQREQQRQEYYKELSMNKDSLRIAQRPEQVPVYADYEILPDGTGYGSVIYWIWTDPDTGVTKGLKQAVVPKVEVDRDLLSGRPKELPSLPFSKCVRCGTLFKISTWIKHSHCRPCRAAIGPKDARGRQGRIPEHTGPSFDGLYWHPCPCDECDPVVKETRRTLRESLVRRLA